MLISNIKDLLRKPFSVFYKEVFKHFTGIPYNNAEYMDKMLECFDDIYSQKITNLNVSIPPRLGKTTLSNIFSVYTLLNNPASNIIILSSNYRLILRSSSFIRDIIRIYLPYTGTGASLSKSDASKSSISIVNKSNIAIGSIFLATAEMALIGIGAGGNNIEAGYSGHIILDDLTNMSTVNSVVYRTNLEEIYSSTVESRRNAVCATINIAQRSHVKDFTNFFLTKSSVSDNVVNLTLPLVDEHGKILNEKIYSKARIAQLKKNDFVFQCIYQQNPVESTNNIFLDRHFHRKHEIKDDLNKMEMIMIVGDTAFTAKDYNDASVFFVIAVDKQDNIILIDFMKLREEFNELKNKIITLNNKYCNYRGFCGLFIENKASGISLIQELRRLGISAKSLSPEEIMEDITLGKDKVSRAISILEYINDNPLKIDNKIENQYDSQNQIYLTNKNIDEIISEIIGFPNDRYDDAVDTLVYTYILLFKKLGLGAKFYGQYFLSQLARI